MGDELVVIDKNGIVRYANEAVARGVGYRREDIVGRKITDFYKKRISIKQWRKDHFEAVKRKKRPVTYHVERVGKNGRPRTIEVTSVHLDCCQGGFMVAVARDVTEQLTTQKALKQSEDLYRLISESADDAIFIIDLESRITYVNKSGENYIGRPASQIKGRSFLEYVHPGSISQALSSFRKAKQAKDPFHMEIEVVVKNKETIPVEVAVSPLVKNGRGVTAIHAIVRDIRQRRQLEQLKTETEKMKAVQYFVSGTAQELHYPLLAILTKTRDLLTKYQARDFEYISYKEFDGMLRTLENISSQVRYCCDTTKRLIDLNKKRAGLSRGSCDVNQLVRRQMKGREKQFSHLAVKYKLNLSSDLPSAAISEIELEQILSNLVNNAVQAMPGGGHLTIKTGYARSHKMLKIELKDDGVGISGEDLKHIFEPFFTTKQRGLEGNSGLGLPIVYSLVKACRGDIVINSSLRRGTSVSVLIPAHKT